jgi:flagellar basal-body rod protein FlgB
MGIDFNSALGPHPQALATRALRTTLLAGNLANADTPGFKARDIDFAAVMAGSTGGRLPLSTTAPAHLGGRAAAGADVLYRVPDQPAVDGNTVEGEREMALFAENAVQFETAFTLLNRRFASLIGALKGE